MFDVWLGDIKLTELILIFSVVVLLPLQILLCFKVKNKFIRFFPLTICSVLTAIFTVMLITSTGWDSLGYLFLVILSGFMLFMCIVGCGIWAIIKFIKKKLKA